MIRLAERTYEEAAGLARDPKTVLVFPLGTIEEHGPHLPLLVDWLGAEELARVIAPYLRRAGWRPVLVPSMPYGASPLAVAAAPGVPGAARCLSMEDYVRGVGGHARGHRCQRAFMLTILAARAALRAASGEDRGQP